MCQRPSFWYNSVSFPSCSGLPAGSSICTAPAVLHGSFGVAEYQPSPQQAPRDLRMHRRAKQTWGARHGWGPCSLLDYPGQHRACSRGGHGEQAQPSEVPLGPRCSELTSARAYFFVLIRAGAQRNKADVGSRADLQRRCSGGKG